MEETFDIKFESSLEKFTIKIKTKDFDKFASAIYNLCLDNKIDAEVIKEEKTNGKEERNLNSAG